MDKKLLQELYLKNKLSTLKIAQRLNCSLHKIDYWMAKYNIQKRTISEAIYQQKNPNGDPFKFKKPSSINKSFLFGLGLGLFWGEGSKKSVHSLKLSNSDPELVKKFIEFMLEIYKIDKNRLRFQLQTYDDLEINNLVKFWSNFLSVRSSQFYKTTLLKRRGSGTYHQRMKYGVIIVSFNNMKLRNLIIDQIANMQYL